MLTSRVLTQLDRSARSNCFGRSARRGELPELRLKPTVIQTPHLEPRPDHVADPVFELYVPPRRSEFLRQSQSDHDIRWLSIGKQRLRSTCS